MRGVFSQTRRVAAALLLSVILLAPAAFASDTANTSLWNTFIAWLMGRIGIPGGVTAPEEDQSRLGVPNG